MSNGPRTCVCGEQIQWDESYGPASQTLFKWYENGKAFGQPAVRRKFYLCRTHTNELVDYLEALSEGHDITIIRRNT